jgi:hypothetical protein
MIATDAFLTQAMQHFESRTAPRGAGNAGYAAADDAQAPSPGGGAAGGAPGASPGGWDPLEVWRTRVRDARRDAPLPSSA